MATLEEIPEPYNSAHKLATKNREALLKLPLVGCFYCYQTYPPTEIAEWCDSGQTAICPKCGIDSVLHNTDHEFLKAMGAYWFALAPLTDDEKVLFKRRQHNGRAGRDRQDR